MPEAIPVWWLGNDEGQGELSPFAYLLSLLEGEDPNLLVDDLIVAP